jgi:hypothetical protein
MIIPIILSVCLLTIFLQDLKTRSVHWSLFLLVFCLSLFISPILFSVAMRLSMVLNMAFILFLLAGLTLYLSFQNKRFINITKGFFSWGDILFLFAITPLFSFQPFVYFFTAGTILSLVYQLILQRFVPDKTIPYAGFMALNTLVFVVGTRIMHLPHFFSFRL